MAQFVTRIEDDLADAVDGLVAAEVVASRSDAVRKGLRILIDEHRRQVVAKAIVDGYRRHPQSDDEVHWADAATAAMIADEPW
jgi:metal-responsive CopG/Arc/MetJ family transcriptional regulator